MATSKPRSPKKNAAASKVAGKAAARASDSGASRAPPAGTGDLPAQRAADIDATVAAMPYNENKAAEHGHANALAPPQGTQVEPPSGLVGASTLAEANRSGKTGEPATRGDNPTVGPLHRVRVAPLAGAEPAPPASRA